MLIASILFNNLSFLGFLLFLGILALVLKLFYTRDGRFAGLRDVIPGPPQLPLFGNTFDFIMKPLTEVLKQFETWRDVYGPRVLFRIGTYWIVSLAGTKDLERLLSSTNEIVKSVDYDLLIPWLGEGLLVSKGEKWSKRRKLLTPAFHFKILEQFLSTINEQTQLLVDLIQDKQFEDGTYFDIIPYLTRCTLDIICETAMGVKVNAQTDTNGEFLRALDKIKEIQVYRSLRPWLEPPLVWNLFSYGLEEKRLIRTLHEFTEKVIRERKEEFLAKKAEEGGGKKRRLAFLDLLFEAQLNEGAGIIDDDGIREETDTFMFAGHDTTSTAASFTIFHIGAHPQVQATLATELTSVFGSDKSRLVTAEDLGKLKYLEACIKESMRLTAPVPMTARCIQSDFELEAGVILPPNTLVMIFPFLLHRDPSLYPSPLEYKPERFLSLSGRDPFAFLPFSAGQRNCIGQKFAMMEEKILLANLFRRLEVTCVDNLEDLGLTNNMVLRAERGIRVRVKSRC